jgi:two-component system, OmpR family, KDP operon response regulator KdpE
MSKPHILVVEDQPEFQRALTFRLEAQGFQVEIAEDGGAAELCLGIHQFDVILLKDVLADGPVDSRLRDWRHQGKNMPVIMMTTAPAADPLNPVPAHADGTIARPFAISDLILEIERVTVAS